MSRTGASTFPAPHLGRAFSWSDAANRSDVVHAAMAVSRAAIAIQVTRPLSAGGKFEGPPLGGAATLLDLRGDLWLTDDKLGEPRHLSALQGGAWAPRFSPDGKRLAALTLVDDGKVGVAVWDLSAETYRIFSRANVEILLARFRTYDSAYAAPSPDIQVPCQYTWLDSTSILFVDHGAARQQFALAYSSLSSTLREKREKSREGERSLRLWSDQSMTCGVGSRLVRMSCVTGRMETLYEGDVRGVSLSPNRRRLAALVVARRIRPAPNRRMDWPVFPLTGLEDALVELKLMLIDIGKGGGAREIEGVSAVGNVAPSLLPLWDEAGTRIAVPVSATYSNVPTMRHDAVWEVSWDTGAARTWPASSVLDAELLAALLTTNGLSAKAVIERRPQKTGPEVYAGWGGIARGGAWRCAPQQVLWWCPPTLRIMSPDHTTLLSGEFTSVQPPNGQSVGRTVAVHSDGGTSILTTWADTYRMESLEARPEWTLLGISPRNSSVVYKCDDYDGTFLFLATPNRRPRKSSLTFNTYFRDILRPRRRMLTHTFPDGCVRSGLLQLPIDHSPGARHPVVLWAYPNWKPSIEDSFSRANSVINVVYPIQYLLTKGFAVFQAPFPISGKRSRKPMQAAADAVVPWLDVLRQQPEIAPGEYAFFGHSNAGYAGLALEALTNRFRAIAVWNTFPELGYDELHSYAGDVALDCAANVIQADRAFTEGAMQPYAPHPSLPWKNPFEYIRSDPLFNLARASTPLLLVEGEFDADPREMEEVYSILYGRGVPVQLAYYWGEDHVFVSPGNIRDSWVRTEEFFRRHLRKG